MKNDRDIRIFLDITETASNRLRTGIQRVVRRTIHAADKASRELGVELMAVIAIEGAFHRVKDGHVLLRERPPERMAAPRRAVRRLKASAVALGKRLLAAAPALASAARRMLYAHRASRVGHDSVEKHALVFQNGDVVVLLDSFWGSTALDAAVRAQDQGASIATIVYDLIPLSHPQHFDEHAVVQFTAAMQRVLSHADYVFCISAFCAGELRSLFPSCKAAIANTIEHFRLGSDFHSLMSAPGREPEARLPEAFFDGEPVFLMIGTLEPRKGHAFVLDALERRWRAGGSGKLLILGKVGWKVEHVLRRIRLSPEFGGRLCVIHDATDMELAAALQKSYACIQASEVEGFGLPIVEAMQMGLPVLASDIPVFREIGGELPVYFSLGDPDNLVHAVDELVRRYPEVRARVAGFRWLTWDDATVSLFSQVLAMHARRLPAPTGPTACPEPAEQLSAR